MNKKFSIIKINGFKGLALAVFIIGCLIAGFLIFPGWVCMQLWNFVAGFFYNMPVMTLLRGTMLWAIVALSMYALNKGNFAISFGSVVPRYPERDERLYEIMKQINESNAKLSSAIKKHNEEECTKEEENQDNKLLK